MKGAAAISHKLGLNGQPEHSICLLGAFRRQPPLHAPGGSTRRSWGKVETSYGMFRWNQRRFWEYLRLPSKYCPDAQ